MKRKVMLWAISLLAGVLILFGIIFALGTQSKVSPLRSDTIVASLPIVASQPLFVETAGLNFKIDTGSDLSCLTPGALDTLRASGVNISESYKPVLGRNSTGRYTLAFKRYIVDLPLEFVTAHTDSAGVRSLKSRLAERDNVLRGVEFVVIDDKDAVPSLGIDLLQHFAVEYLYEDQLIRLHSTRPEGYQDFSSFRASLLPIHTIWPGKRYYIDIDVDNIPNSYFIDTGLRRAAVKLPASRADQSRRRLDEDSLISYLGRFDAKTDNAWVECGNRAGSQIAYYCDNGEEAYSINPINVFTQDLLLDFINSSIALRPYVSLPRRHFLDRTTVNEDDRLDSESRQDSSAGFFKSTQ